MTTFDDFGLDERIGRAVSKLGFEIPTSIQKSAIPVLLEGRDVIGRARTGSGKTAAFGLPLVERVKDGGRAVRALVLVPTRELAMQVAAAIETFAIGTPVKVVTIYGGAPYGPQLRALKTGVSVVVGTPGRVIDHMERGTLDLSHVEMLVLDEADEMLRMGFIEPIEQVMSALPADRQIALFSATMPRPIERIARRFLVKPVVLPVDDDGVEHIKQCYLRVSHHKKLAALSRVLLGTARGTTLVFARTRVGCAEIADALAKSGIPADAIHGDLNQAARERVIGRLRARTIRVLVATDVAARGIDITHITHVFFFDVPGATESYIHRIGRTARAGAEGTAITFVTTGERRRLQRMERELKVHLKEVFAPGNDELESLRREGIWSDLQRFTTGTDDMRAWLQSLVDEQQVTPEDVALAALTLLCEQREIPLEEVPRAGPDRTDRPARGERPTGTMPSEDERQELNQVELFIAIGRRAGIQVGDIVGAITHEAGVPGNRIGRVRIFDHKCFVGVPKDVAEYLVNSYSTLVIRGKSAKVSLSRGESYFESKSKRRQPRNEKRTGFKGSKKRQGGKSQQRNK
jgi:ATP-dependent RNA helicase DeaD